MASDKTATPRRLNDAERKFLRHMGKPRWNVINKSTWYICFFGPRGETWVPGGPTGATAHSLMQKGLLDFAAKPGTIGNLVRIGRKSCPK